MNDPIQVSIGVAYENNPIPMGFWIYDDGVAFDDEMTKDDIELAQAILLDLTEALAKKLKTLVN